MEVVILGKIKVKDRTMAFINSYNYDKIGSVKKAIRNLLQLESQAQIFGSEGAMIIMTDVKSGMDYYPSSPFKVLTDKQREAIRLCLVEDRTESEAADQLGISQQAVNACVNSGVKRIRDYLVTGEMVEPVFSREETMELIALYRRGKKPLEIARLLGKSPRTIRNKIKYLKAKGQLKRSEAKVGPLGD